ncbi:hypothetical protein, partial [Klebsiella pneumoniae]
MPDFVAALFAAAAFCMGVIAFNALTRAVVQMQIAPSDLGENGLAQFGGALLLARVAYRYPRARRD